MVQMKVEQMVAETVLLLDVCLGDMKDDLLVRMLACLMVETMVLASVGCLAEPKAN